MILIKILVIRVLVIFIDFIWIIFLIVSLIGDFFCINEVVFYEGIGNYCVCQNGEILSVILFVMGGNVLDY